METIWKYVKPLNNPLAVKQFLKAYNIELPQRLIESMEDHNAGRPSKKRIITSTGREYVFKAMLSYNRQDKETIFNVYPELFQGTSWFPVASDAAGNFVCFDLKSKKYILLNHETGEGEIIVKMPCVLEIS